MSKAKINAAMDRFVESLSEEQLAMLMECMETVTFTNEETGEVTVLPLLTLRVDYPVAVNQLLEAIAAGPLRDELVAFFSERNRERPKEEPDGVTESEDA